MVDFVTVAVGGSSFQADQGSGMLSYTSWVTSYPLRLYSRRVHVNNNFALRST